MRRRSRRGVRGVTAFEVAEMRRLGACPVCARCEAMNTYRPGGHEWHIGVSIAARESEVYKAWLAERRGDAAKK